VLLFHELVELLVLLEVVLDFSEEGGVLVSELADCLFQFLLEVFFVFFVLGGG
jgi:hypothetical protein